MADNWTGQKPVDADASHIRIPAKLQGEGFVRADSLNENDRTVEVVWAAGALVKRYSWDEGYYMEKLSMDPKAIRMDRFNAGMSLLDSHDAYSMDSRIGTVIPGSVKISGGRGTALVKLSRNERGEQLFQDLRDGHPFPVSVGYKTHAYERKEGSDKALPVLTAIDWEPFELSAVPVPADAGAHSRSEKRDGEPVEIEIRSHETSSSAEAGDEGEARMAQAQDTGKKPGENGNPNPAADGQGGEGENQGGEGEGQRSLQQETQGGAGQQAQQGAALAANAQNGGGEPPAQQRGQAPAPAMSEDQVRAAVAAALREERQRTDTITAFGRQCGMTDAFIRDHIARATSEEAFRAAILTEMVRTQQDSPTFSPVSIRVVHDEGDTRRAAMAEAVLHREGIVRGDLSDAARAGGWRQMSGMEIAQECLMRNGERPFGISKNEIVKRALHTTTDFPMLLGDITRQSLLNGYQGVANTFDLIATLNVLTDFREVNVLDVGNAPDLLLVNEHGEFKRGTVRESKEGIQLATYGRVLGLTRQMIINDQLGAFARVVQSWGQKVAKLEGDIVWGMILDNTKTMKDGQPFFAAAHGNVGTGQALDEAGLTAGLQAFRRQKDIDGVPVALPAKYLFTGTALEIAASKLLTGVTTPQTTQQVVPQAIRALTPVYEYRIDLMSGGDTTWFLFGDPGANGGRGVQYARLAGQEQPFYDERIGFDVDGMEFKVRHDFGAGFTDFRNGYRNAA